jgi:tRNA pseudouridine13 synthase
MHYGDRPIGLPDLPRVHGEAVFNGVYRRQPDEFCVTEVLGFVPEGVGPHWWVLIEKVGLSTDEAQSRLARACGVSRKDVGYAGKKDTCAVARQWMSLPESARIGVGAIDSALQVIEVTRNQRKLKIGQLAGNQFELVLHGDVVGDLEARVTAIRERGVANYFGLQRFGRHGSNLQSARRLAQHDPEGRRRLHPKDGMAASAARSAGFNAVLAAHIEAGQWLSVEVDDVVSLAGRGSHFSVTATNREEVRTRIAAGELDPTGPMLGRHAKTGAAQAAREWRILETDAVLYPWLTGVFRDADRRAMRVIPKQLVSDQQGSTLQLQFYCPRGAFATAVLHELGVLSESRA